VFTRFHIAAADGKLQIINIILGSATSLDINVRDHKGKVFMELNTNVIVIPM